MPKKNLKDLERQCNSLRRDGNRPFELAEMLMELASCYQDKKMENKVISCAKEAADVLDTAGSSLKVRKLESFVHRVLAEAYAEDGNRQLALFHAERFRRSAKESANLSQIQMSLHVTAWIYEKLWVAGGSINIKDLQDAYKYGQSSIRYLDEHSAEILRDTEAVERCGLPDNRRAQLERLLCGIAGNLGNEADAERYWRRAMDYAKRKNDAELRFELQILQLDFPWANKRKLAQILVNEAPAKRKGWAMLELSQVYIYEGNMEKAFDILVDILARYRSDFINEDFNVLKNRIVFVYNFKDALSKINSETINKTEKRRLYEKMGDWMVDYSTNNKETLTQALHFYSKMLMCSSTDKERIPALISLAGTYSDLNRYQDALKYYYECLECEIREKIPREKSVATLILIFNTKCSGSLESKMALESSLKELLNDIPEHKRLTKRNICKTFAEYLSKIGDPAADQYHAKALTYQGLNHDSSEDEEDMDENDYKSEVDNTEHIFRKCEFFAQRKNDEEHIVKRINWRNNHGESELHQEAKTDNTNRLKLLLKYNYDVNARDNSGWTPLHEAVNHQRVINVKILLAAGAKVDAMSNDNDEGALDEGRIGGKITPLMDACANLSAGEDMIQIAEVLFRHKPEAVTRCNSDGWTAADFTMDSIKRLEEQEDTEGIRRAKALLEMMKKQFEKAGLQLRQTPPPTKRKHKTVETKNAPRKSEISRVEGVTDYQNAMMKVGARTRRSPVRIEADLTASSLRVTQTDFHDFDDDFVFHDVENIRPSSPILSEPEIEYTQMQRSLTRRLRQEDDFIIDDIGESTRKRKSRESNSQQPKRLNRRSYVSEISLGPKVSPIRERSPDLIIEPVNRTDVPSIITRIPTQVVSQTSSKLSVTISFFESGGEQIRNNLLTLFESSAIVHDIHERCTKNLPVHQKEFSICLEDGTEVDPEMPLNMLKKSDVEAIRFKCVIKRSSADSIFQSYHSDFIEEEEVVRKLAQLCTPSGSSEIDLSKVEVDHCIQLILRAVVESSNPVNKVILNYCDLGNVDASTFCIFLNHCRELYACASNITQIFVQQIVEANCTFSNLIILDLSFNNLSDAALISFIRLCPSLTRLIANGLNLSEASNSLIDNIAGLTNLSYVSLANTKIEPDVLECMFSSCSQLTYLDIGSLLINFTFSPCWLPALQEICMAGSIIENWDSLIDWISLSGLKKVDLSCTSIKPDHIMALYDRKVDESPLILRIVRCPHIEYAIKPLKEEILQFLLARTSSIRLQMSSELVRVLKSETAHASEFLVD